MINTRTLLGASSLRHVLFLLHPILPPDKLDKVRGGERLRRECSLQEQILRKNTFYLRLFPSWLFFFLDSLPILTCTFLCVGLKTPGLAPSLPCKHISVFSHCQLEWPYASLMKPAEPDVVESPAKREGAVIELNQHRVAPWEEAT